MAWWLWVVIAIGCVVAIVLMACFAIADDDSPHSIPRGEDPWHRDV